MKLLASLAAVLTVLSAQVALAMPAVGDTATFSGTTINAGKTYPLQISTQITAYDQSAQSFTQVTLTQVAGQSQSRTEQVAATDMLTEATVNALLANCAANNGVSETVVVPAGTFETCKVTAEDGALYNIGRVPFGITQMASEATNLQLVSYVSGK